MKQKNNIDLQKIKTKKMNKVRIILMLTVMAISATTFAQKSQKTGFINSNELLSTMPERMTVQKELETYTAELRTTLDAMSKEYETKVAAFQSKQDVMTDIIKQTKIKEITDLEKRITEFQQTAEADLQKKEQALLKPIVDKAKDAIKAVAIENGYTSIEDTSSGLVIYFDEKYDILSLVKKKLGME